MLKVLREQRWLLLGVSVACGLLFLLWWHPIQRIDTVQRRNTIVFHFKDNHQQITQTFRANHNGFNMVKVWVAVFDPDKLKDQTTILTAALLDQNGIEVASTEKAITALGHNAVLEFVFPTQYFSKNKQYQFQLTVENAQDVVGLWGSNYDSYHEGTAIADIDGDIRFETRYRFTVTELFSGLQLWLPRWVLVGLATVLGIIVPGLTVLQLHPHYNDLDSTTRLAFGFGSGISVIALLWLALTQIGLRWTTVSAWGVTFIFIGVLVAVRRPYWRSVKRHSDWSLPDKVLAVLLGLLFVTRIVNIQHLVFPALVDTPNHALLTQILLDAGNIAPTLGPQWLDTPLYYHIGMHAVVASLQLLLPHVALTDIFLIFTQLLVIGAALAAYGMTRYVTKNQWMGIVALVFVGFVSRFPNQFTDWGRITQLAGQITLLVLMWIGLTSLATKRAKLNFPIVVVIGILAAGLTLVHIRVTAFFGVFALACLLVNWRFGLNWIASGMLTSILSAPWMYRIYSNVVTPAESAQKALSSGTTSYTKFPTNYLWETPFIEQYWLPIAVLGLLLAMWHRKRWAMVIALWLSLQFLVLNLDQFGLRTTWVITNHTFYITLFVPACIMLAYGVVKVFQANVSAQPYIILRQVALGMLIGAVALIGWHNTVNVIEPGAVLGTTADQEAMDWIEANTTLDDHFLINLWPWYDNTIWAGADAGYWIPAVTGRTTTTPTFWYPYNKAYAQQVFEFGTVAWATSDVNTPEFLTALENEGVTHVYIGPQGQHFTPSKFLNSEHYTLEFTNGLAWIFKVN